MRFKRLLFSLGFDSALSGRVLMATSSRWCGHGKLAEEALLCATIFLLVAAVA